MRSQRSKRSRKTVALPVPTPEHGFETRAIHQSEHFQEETGAVVSPIFATSTFVRGNRYGFDYTRSGNPNFTNLASTLASLEGAQYATVFASGVSAITAVISSFKSGDRVLAEENLYGSTFRLLERVFRKFGLLVEYCDFTDRAQYARIRKFRPTLIWLESPTNPLLKILDIRAIAKAAHECGSLVLVDNTFASSVLQKPLALGVDLSLTSTTKFLNGHSDCLGGVVCTNSQEWQEKMIFAQKALGLMPSPFDAWLVTRGVKTAALRLKRHCESALRIATVLETLNCARWVRYPYLPSHPQHAVAIKQMAGGSGIITVDFDLSPIEVQTFLRELTIFVLAESLGAVESLVCHPATMTHASIPEKERDRLGITSSLVRFSIGIESASDLLADIRQALLTVRPKDRSLVNMDIG